jgi:hypothetical protein
MALAIVILHALLFAFLNGLNDCSSIVAAPPLGVILVWVQASFLG